MARAYLDHNATSPLRPEARAAMVEALSAVGNASSVHAEGRGARRLLEAARAEIARCAGVPAACVTFTSGGTEAAATLLSPDFRGAQRGEGPTRSLIVSAVEHSCVLGGGRFPPHAVHVCPVDGTGQVDLQALDLLLERVEAPALVAVMAANNETGVLQPVAEIGRLAAERGAALVVDAVQAFGKTPLDAVAAAADAFFVSAHKIGGPQGVGAIVRRSEAVSFAPLMAGTQEARLRAGTENVAGIAGFAAAAAAAFRDFSGEIQRMAALRDWLEAEIVTISPDSRAVGGPVARLANTSLMVHPGLGGETALIALDLEGVAVSTGSACASGKVKASHVLQAMGLPDALARSALRVSFGWSSTKADAERCVAAFSAHVRRIAARAA